MTFQAIPLLDLKAQYATIRDEVNEAIQRVVESQYFILGPEVKSLEEEIAAYSRCKFGIGVSSGSDAILVALMVIGIKPGDEVITTAYSFFATAGAIARLGAKCVFVDIDPNTYNIDISQIAERITDRTRAVIPVHLYGQASDMSPIMEISAQHNLTVIEDAAQAIGTEYQGMRVGAIGHMACFSFFPSKNLGAFGDGGMVTTNDTQLSERLRVFRNHGHKPKYYNAVIGGNFRLDAIQAAVLRVKLNYLDAWTEARQRNAATYHHLFVSSGLSVSLEEFDKQGKGLVLPFEVPTGRHIYNQFIIRCHHRDALVNHLKKYEIGCEVYYPVPLHLQECFADLGYKRGNLPHSERAANETLALPIYPELTEEMQIRIVDTIAAFYENI